MKTALFAPYGSYKKETGLMYLLANYLGKIGSEVVQLKCNGCFVTCGRDELNRWNRTLFTCARCMGEQKSLAGWAGIKTREVSSFVTPEDVGQTDRWLRSLSSVDLLRAEFRGVNLFGLCDRSFEARFGHRMPNIDNGPEERYLRELIGGAVQAAAAFYRFLEATTPVLNLVSGNGDYLSRVYLAQARAMESQAAVFSFDPQDEVVHVLSSTSDEVYSTRLVFDGIVSMRSDHRTWAPELLAVIHEILSFLGFGSDRMPWSGDSPAV